MENNDPSLVKFDRIHILMNKIHVCIFFLSLQNPCICNIGKVWDDDHSLTGNHCHHNLLRGWAALPSPCGSLLNRNEARHPNSNSSHNHNSQQVSIVKVFRFTRESTDRLRLERTYYWFTVAHKWQNQTDKDNIYSHALALIDDDRLSP